jgi:hypothetical protein
MEANSGVVAAVTASISSHALHFLSRDGCRRRPRPGEVLTPMPTKRKKGLARLTVQQLKLLEGLNAGLTITEAGRQAG